MIFIYSWNTQSAEYTEANSNFINDLAIRINDSYCELAVIGLQEDSVNSNIIDILSEKLKTNGWDKVAESELYGWGATTFKTAVKEWKIVPRGVHIVVFNRNWIIKNYSTTSILAPGIYNQITYGKGGVVVNLESEMTGKRFTFLNIHLPFDSSSLKDPESRFDALMWQAYCFNYLKSETLKKYPDTNYLFILGDFNFRTSLDNPAELTNSKLYKYNSKNIDNDELQILWNYNFIERMNEGIENSGISFYPTCKLKHSRNIDYPDLTSNYNLGKNGIRVPSWCDRILYSGDEIYCVHYDRWDHSDMQKSDHAAVYSMFETL